MHTRFRATAQIVLLDELAWDYPKHDGCRRTPCGNNGIVLAQRRRERNISLWVLLTPSLRISPVAY